MSTPQSLVRILRVPLNNRYEHTYYFKDKAEQSAFFDSKVVKTFSAYTFIRKTWDLQVQATMTEAETWSYLTFRNSTTGKNYYYFINNIEYVNDNNVRLSLEIDVMQTYMFDYGLRESFVERQHVTSDKVGEHTVDEGLDIGQLTTAHTYHIEDLMEMVVLTLSAINLPGFVSSNYQTTTMESSGMIDRVYSGLVVYATEVSDVVEMSGAIANLDTVGKADAVYGQWMYPKALVKLKSGEWGDGSPFKLVGGYQDKGTNLANWENYKSKIFGGYTPHNNKLYTHPYNFLYVSNNGGGYAEYRYDLFTDNSDGTYPFMLTGAIAPDANARLAPVHYNGVAGNNNEEAIAVGNYPTCAWASDTYTVWLAQNQHSQNLAIINGTVTASAGVAGLAAGLVTLNPTMIAGGVGATYGGLSQVQGVLAQRKDMQSQPPQAKGNYSASVNVATNRQTFTAYYRCLFKEYAQQIDEYFDRYGYAIRRVMVPNTCARTRYTYVKTIGCTLTGNLCSEDLSKIASIFDKGVTFWNDKDTFGYYGDNPIL